MGEGTQESPRAEVGKHGRERKQKRDKSRSRPDPKVQIRPGSGRVKGPAPPCEAERLLGRREARLRAASQGSHFKRDPAERTQGAAGKPAGWVLQTQPAVGITMGL